jgi:hypothetical protein
MEIKGKTQKFSPGGRACGPAAKKRGFLRRSTYARVDRVKSTMLTSMGHLGLEHPLSLTKACLTQYSPISKKFSLCPKRPYHPIYTYPYLALPPLRQRYNLSGLTPLPNLWTNSNGCRAPRRLVRVGLRWTAWTRRHFICPRSRRRSGTYRSPRHTAANACDSQRSDSCLLLRAARRERRCSPRFHTF